MVARLSCWVLPVCWVMVVVGCDRTPVKVDPRAVAGKAVGKISDWSGQGVYNCRVAVLGFPKDKGELIRKELRLPGPALEYAMDLPEGMYGAPTAEVTAYYNERTYVLPLAPTDGLREWPEQRDGQHGLVRDFEWKLSGAKLGGSATSPEGYWGASIQFDKQGDLGDLADIEITLKPDGPLIDGSDGKTLTFVRRVPWNRQEDHYLFDVPIGRYTATAKMLFGSKPKPLRLTTYTISPLNADSSPEVKPAKSVTVEFECHEVKPGEWRVFSPYLIAFPSQ